MEQGGEELSGWRKPTATKQRTRRRQGKPHPATEEGTMRGAARQSPQLPKPRLLPRGQRSRLLMQLKGRRGSRLASGKGLGRRQRGRKGGAVSPPVKKRGWVPGRGVPAALQVRASLESLQKAPRRRRARKSQVPPLLSRQIQIRRRLGVEVPLKVSQDDPKLFSLSFVKSKCYHKCPSLFMLSLGRIDPKSRSIF